MILQKERLLWVSLVNLDAPLVLRHRFLWIVTAARAVVVRFDRVDHLGCRLTCCKSLALQRFAP